MPESLRKSDGDDPCAEWGHDDRFFDYLERGYLVYKCKRCGHVTIKDDKWYRD